jgi:hypothetical protein
MKKWVGRFIYDLVARYIRYLDDADYDNLMERTYRPAFARRREFPMSIGNRYQMFSYTRVDKEEKNEIK